eukprot:TRINITY_DN8696_c0_g2_i1.p1 TRINITY_DN8696_c0_g2~~TRINITY_DN8696_c0_g2_i1.p1  ORF type:complete len:167 (-),score=50.61 TRINITY_DN8696_c0_g2_i1:18-518(-)
MIKGVFAPLASDKSLSETQYKYVISALIEYQRSLHEAELAVEVSTQVFCIHFLADMKEYHWMQMMLQYQSFTDSLEVAQALVYASHRGYSKALLWAIDMYHRIKRPGEVIRLLLNTERVKEVLKYVEQTRVKGVSVTDILEVVRRLPGVDGEKFVRYFAKASVCFG